MSADRGRRLSRILAWSFGLASIVWNGVFDASIAEATRQFVAHRDADPSLLPIRVDLAMHAAIVHCAGVATLASVPALLLACGLGAFLTRARTGRSAR